MEKDLIYGIVYTIFDDLLGPQPVLWYPDPIPEDIRVRASVKAITLLAGEDGFIPDTVITIPFPSLSMKGIVKYVRWSDGKRRGGYALAAIILLFKEVDDLIYYKYMKDLEANFDELALKLTELREIKENEGDPALLISFREKIINALNKLRNVELALGDQKAFPDQELEGVEYVYKIIVVGDPEVGKTSTILRFTDNAFKRTYIPTIGINITKKFVKLGENNIQFIIWDVAGQSKFERMRSHFYEGADGFLLIFDLTNPESFESVSAWNQDIKDNLEEKPIVGYILGNKNDLKNKRKINEESALKLSNELNLDYIETSALTGENIDEAFHKIAEKLINQ